MQAFSSSSAILILILVVAATGQSVLPMGVESWVVFSEEPLKFDTSIRSAVTKIHKVAHQSIYNKNPKNTVKESAVVSMMNIYRISGLHPETQHKARMMQKILSNTSYTIEPNIQFHLNGLQSTTSWALDILNQPGLPLDSFITRHPFINGTAQHAFVVDTGVYNHPSFIHSVQYDYDAVNSPMLMADPNGHGSHVAGLIASPGYGTAPYSTIHSVRVLDENGLGYLDDVTSGLQWIYYNGPQKPCVISLSLGSPVGSTAMTNIINALINDKHYVMVVAAGNDNQDATNSYPARLPNVITVGASDEQDRRAYFSNYGPIVDIYAPGNNILSLSNTGSGIAYKSGTSMATPLVSGALCLLLQAKEMYPDHIPYGGTTDIQSMLQQSFSVSNNNLDAARLYLQFDSIYQNLPSSSTAPLLQPSSPISKPSPPKTQPITALPSWRAETATVQPFTTLEVYFFGIFFILVIAFF